MAETGYSSQRKRMIAGQVIRRGLHDPRIITAMENVPRERFVQPDDLAWAFADGALPIGQGQTISQPYIVALMTHLLQVDSASRVLEIGTGSGYQAAVLGNLVKEVHTVELIPELASRAAQLLSTLGYKNIQVHLGDGSLGWTEQAPYDGIIVTAASPSIPPPLLEQLADGGRLVIPVGGRGVQSLEVHRRLGSKFTCDTNISVVFVPLRGEHGWK